MTHSNSLLETSGQGRGDVAVSNFVLCPNRTTKYCQHGTDGRVIDGGCKCDEMLSGVQMCPSSV